MIMTHENKNLILFNIFLINIDCYLSVHLWNHWKPAKWETCMIRVENSLEQDHLGILILHLATLIFNISKLTIPPRRSKLQNEYAILHFFSVSLIFNRKWLLSLLCLDYFVWTHDFFLRYVWYAIIQLRFMRSHMKLRICDMPE